MPFNEIFDRLWNDYSTRNPMVKKVHDLFTSEGESVVNDHIAIRTFRNPLIGIDQIALIFLKHNYELMGEYRFDQKKLFAKHYEHKSDKNAPRVFISELLVESCSFYLQQVVKGWIHSIPFTEIKPDELILAGNMSGMPSYTVYEKLRQESEYAAWLYINGFRVNHFTVSINDLKKYDTIQKVNGFLKEKGFLMNDSGGEIQGSPEELLEQSSVKAEMIPFQFTEGKYDATGCYYEFARRYLDPNGELYNGFISKSADKLFESTNFYKK
ncbi:MAG: DUF1338 domain-containing protein [bacterium]